MSCRSFSSVLSFLFIFFSFQFTGSAFAKTLVLGGVRDLFPYEYLDSKDKASGFDIELIMAIARIKGWNVEIRLMDWSSAVEALRNGEVDALTGMLYSEEKQKEFEFSDPHSSIEFAFFTKKNTPPVFSFKDLKGKKTGIHGWASGPDTIKSVEGSEWIYFNDMKELFSSLSRGDVDVVICPKMVGLHSIARFNLPDIVCLDIPILIRQSCLAVRKGNRALLDELNDGLFKLKESGEYFRLGKVLFKGIEPEAPLNILFILGSLPILGGFAFLAIKFIKGKRRIQDRITFSFLGISMIPLLIIGALTYFNERSIIKDKVGNHLESISELKARLLSQWIEEAKSACLEILNDPFLMESINTVSTIYKKWGKESFQGKMENLQYLREYMRGLVKIKGYDEALVIDLDGTVILSTDTRYQGWDMKGNPHFIGAMRSMPGEVYIKDLYYSERTKNLSIAFSTRITKNGFHGNDVDTIGILVLKVSAERTIYPILGSWPGMGRSGEILLIRKEGDRILFLNNARHLPDTALKFALPILPSSGIVELVFKTLRGERGMEEFKDYREARVLGASSLIPQTGWIVITKQDRREAFYEIDRLMMRNYFIFIFFLAIITSFALAISKSIARPLMAFHELVEKVARGSLDVEPNIKQDDEIGRLARSFKEMVESLKERFSRSERLSALGKLSAGLAHEIRTPLTSIKVTIQSLEKQLHLDEDQKEDFALIKKEIDRLNETVSRFLDFARPPHPTFRSTDINLLIEETLNLIQSKIVSGKVHVETDLERNLEKIQGDEKQLRQVFLNLMLNALEAMPHGGTLRISTHPHGGKEQLRETDKNNPKKTGYVEVLISDTGEGIPTKYRAYIFDPFFTTKDGGTGLGLSIVFSIVESHNGWIEVESSENQGTTFRIILPISQEIKG